MPVGGPIVVHGGRQHDHAAGATHWTPVLVYHPISYLFTHSRCHNFFFNTSWSICLSRLRSATSCLRCLISSSSWRRRRSSLVPMPLYFFFQLKNVAWVIPNFRHTSSTRVPVSACLRAKAICASVHFDFFTVFWVWFGIPHPPNITRKTLLDNVSILWGEVSHWYLRNNRNFLCIFFYISFM